MTSNTAPQPDPSPPQPDDALDDAETSNGGLSSAVVFVLLLALSVASLVIALEAPAPLVHAEAAREALRAAGAEGGWTGAPPVVLTSPRGEELIWHTQGSIALRPPWARGVSPPDYVALALDPRTLPDGSMLVPNQLVEAPPWIAKRYTKPGAATDAAPLLGRLRAASVSAGERGCSEWRGDRWFCGPHAWNWVGPIDLTVAGATTRCMWLHPLDGKRPLTVRWEGLPPGQLSGRIGLSDEAAATAGGAPVTLLVDVDGRQVLKHVHRNARGWTAIQAPLRSDTGAPVTLTLTVTAPSTGRRHVCLDAGLLPAAPAP